MKADMPQNRILEGVRVLTLGQVHALPWGTSFLADLGAQVIRVESLAHLQDRKAGPFPDGLPPPNGGTKAAIWPTLVRATSRASAWK